MNYKTAK